MRTLVAALCLVALVGCWPQPPSTERSTHYDPDRVVQEYLVEYDGGLDETTVAAAFFFVPETPGARQRLSLSKPSHVKHNRKTLGFDQWEGDYRRTLAGLVSTHEWEWMDRRRSVFRNAITLDPVGFVDPPPSVSVSAPVAIEFEPPLEPGEEVLLVVPALSSEPIEIVVARARDSGATLVEPSPLWDDGFWDYAGSTVGLVLIRISETPLGEATSAGGSCATRFRSAPITVAVEP